MSEVPEYPTVAEAGRLFRAGQLSPVETTTACLDRIAALDPTLAGHRGDGGARACQARQPEQELAVATIADRFTAFLR